MVRLEEKKFCSFRKFSTLIFLFFVFSLFHPIQKEAISAERLVIGALSALSGPGSSVGVPWARAVEMLCEDFNKDGGLSIGGKKYTLVPKSYDDKGSAEGGVSAANSLIFKDKAKYIIGPVSSSAAVAIRDSISEPNNVMILTGSWAIKLGPKWPLTFRTTPTIPEIYPEAFKWFHQQYPQATTWGEIELDNAQGQYCANYSPKAVEKIVGVSRAEPEFVDPAAADFFSILNKLLMVRKADLLYSISCRPGQASLIVKQARELGFKGPILVWVAEKVMREGVSAEYLEKIYGMHAFDYESELASPKQKDLAKRYKAKYGEKMNFYAEMPYDAGTALMLAMKKANSIDPNKVKDVLANLEWGGLAGRTYSWGGEKTWGTKRQINRNYYLMVFQKGGEWTVASAVFAPCP